jgi:hypothetical protein
MEDRHTKQTDIVNTTLDTDVLLIIFNLLNLDLNYKDITSLVESSKNFYNIYHNPSFLSGFIREILIKYPDTQIIWKDIIIYNCNEKKRYNYWRKDVNGIKSYNNFLTGIIKTKWHTVLKIYNRTYSWNESFSFTKDIITYIKFHSKYWEILQSQNISINIILDCIKAFRCDEQFQIFIKLTNLDSRYRVSHYQCIRLVARNPLTHKQFENMIKLTDNTDFHISKSYRYAISLTRAQINNLILLIKADFDEEMYNEIIYNPKFNKKAIKKMIEFKKEGFDDINCYYIIQYKITKKKIKFIKKIALVGYNKLRIVFDINHLTFAEIKKLIYLKTIGINDVYSYNGALLSNEQYQKMIELKKSGIDDELCYNGAKESN